MSKRVMALFTLMVLTVSAFSQTPASSRCSLTVANAPSVRGLKLGMSTDELLALFPGSAKRREMMGAVEKAKASSGGEPVYLLFYPATDSGKEQFSGVESVSAGLLNGRVADISVVYGGATWSAIDDWVAKLSETFKLPAAQNWTVGPSENPNKVLRCEGIAVEALTQGGSASIRILSLEILRGLQDRSNAAEEKRRREMKP